MHQPTLGDTAIDRITQSLAPTGHLIACHWRHPMPENPTGGDEVHERLRANSRWQSVAVHIEKDFVLKPNPYVSEEQSNSALWKLAVGELLALSAFACFSLSVLRLRPALTAA